MAGWGDEWLSLNTRALKLASDKVAEGNWAYVQYILPPIGFAITGAFYYNFPEKLDRLNRERYINLAVDAAFWLVLALTSEQIQILQEYLIEKEVLFFTDFQFYAIQAGTSLLIYVARRGIKTFIKLKTDTNFTLYTFKKIKSPGRSFFVVVREIFYY